MSGGDLRESYGTVVLPKGMRLYHVSTYELCELPKKPVLFTTLHPSEWYMDDAYISVIELQQDITLLFMIKLIRNTKIISALNEFLGKPNSNLAKMDYANIQKWIPFLQIESMQGWLSSIENKTTIEFAIINDVSLKLIECLPIRFNWTNTSYNNVSVVPKNWGSIYPIHLHLTPVKMNLHIRFQKQIKQYMQQMEEEDPNGTAFSLLLQNAHITYFDGPIHSIQWPL